MTTQKNSSETSNSGTTKQTYDLHVEKPLCNECEEKTAVVRKRSWLYCADCWLGQF